METQHGLVVHEEQEENYMEFQKVLDLALEGDVELPQDHINSP